VTRWLVPMNSGPGFDIGIDWNTANGRINGVWCDNAGPYTIDCTAVLINPPSTYVTSFGIGLGQLLAIPGTAVSVSVDVNGDLMFDNLQGTMVSPHL